MSREGQEFRLRHQIEKYKRKVGRTSAGFMYNRFNPDLNLQLQSFAFSLQINLNIVIDNTIILPPSPKARYGFAFYAVDVYDPIAPVGILIPDELTKQLYLMIVKHFLYPTWRGYKYNMRIARKFLDASLPIFETFAPIPVWLPRFRKVEAWRNWTSFYNLAFYGCNIYPAPEVFIRVTDSPEDFGNPVQARTERNDNLSSNLYDHAVYDRAFYPRTVAPYPEIILLTPNLYCYQPVYNVANYGYDVYLDKPIFDGNTLIDIIQHFKDTHQPIYQELVWLKHSDRMQTMYAIQAVYQQETLRKILLAHSKVISSPIQIGRAYAFAMEYAYERKLMRLVEAERVIQKYVALGLSEGLLRQIAAITSRK